MKVLTEIWWQIVWFFEGLSVALTYEDDPEMWDNPRKRERIRRRARRERRRHGKKADV
jgi:hypothetical protein